MIFNTGYYHSMDRQNPEGSLSSLGLGIKDIGMSVPLGIAAGDVQGVNAKIRQGTGNIEIQFAGAGGGQRNAQTPEMWGREARQALEEMGRANEVNFNVHATFRIGGMAGQDQHGNFNDSHRKFSVDEVKRAIHFAADTARGGSVVIHTGEFQRPISEEPWAEGGKLFRSFHEEPEKAVKALVDTRTGQVLQQIRKNQIVARAALERAPDDYEYVSQKDYDPLGIRKGETIFVKKDEYVDYEGNKVIFKDRVPKYNKAENRFEIIWQSWDDMVKEAEERNKQKEKELGRQLLPDERLSPEETFLIATTETQERIAKSWAGAYAQDLDKEFESLEKLKKARDFQAKVEAGISEEEKWKLLKRIESDSHGFLPPEYKMPLEILDEQIQRLRQRIEDHREMVTGQQQNAEEQRIIREHAVSAEKYALKRSYLSYAEAGIYAMEETKVKRLPRPIVVTMEHIFPESYGGHPQELKTLILGSRQAMADLLQQKGYSEEQARKAAETHIKGTIDTGHINMWRKYYQGDDKSFHHWIVDQMEDLAQHRLIGNVHLSDNFGYQDDHLAPGQGSSPIKEIMAVLKKHGYKGAVTVEPGADASVDQGDFHGLLKTWRYFGSNVYGVGGVPRSASGPNNWAHIEHGYFGRTYPPYFILGAYAPSNDWRLWSEVQLE